MKSIISNLFTWKNLSNLIENKYVRNNYIFLIIVPIAAKVLSQIESPIEFVFNQAAINLVISLPFNWKLFFYSAVLFTLVNIIFQLFVPAIIQENKSFNEFRDNGKGFSHLWYYLENIGISFKWLLSIEKEKFPVYSSIFSPNSHIYHLPFDIGIRSFLFSNKINLSTKEIEKMELLKHLRDEDYNWQSHFKEPFGIELSLENRLRRSFWDLYNHANLYRIYLRIFCGILVLVGYFILGFVFIQNLIFVIKME